MTCFTTVSLVISNIRGSSICSPKSLYKKTSREILAELKAAFKTGASKFPRPRPVLPSLLRPICQACVNSQLSPTPAVATKRKGEEERNETNFASCNDRSPKWIINDYYIFLLKLRVGEFFFSGGFLSLKYNTLVLCYSTAFENYSTFIFILCEFLQLNLLELLSWFLLRKYLFFALVCAAFKNESTFYSIRIHRGEFIGAIFSMILILPLNFSILSLFPRLLGTF